jgi:hypothetical protein
LARPFATLHNSKVHLLLLLLTVCYPGTQSILNSLSRFALSPSRWPWALFSPSAPRKAALINHSADPRAWRTSLVGHANLHYEQRPSLCVCGLYYPMPLHYSFSLYYLNYVGPYQYSRQLHLDISPLIQSRASSLPSCTVHLLTSLVYFFLTCAMHVLS